MVNHRYRIWIAVVLLWGPWTLSCYDADRSNPLDSIAVALFVPQVSHPTGGEQWFVGTTHQIRWKPATRVIDSFVKIQLVCDGDTILVADTASNTGSYLWEVPGHPSALCRIRVTGHGGASASPSFFRINPKPILERMEIGPEGGWEPAAWRELIIFTSDQHDPDGELYLFNRDTDTVRPLTNNPGFDGEAAWLKPHGQLFAFTSDSGGQGQRDVWMNTTARPADAPIRITTTGGGQPAWQNMTNFSNILYYPALVYKKPVSTEYSNLVAVTLDTPIPVIPVIYLPIAFITLPYQFRLEDDKSQDIIGTPTWMYTDGDNSLVYDVGDPATHLVRLNFPGQNYRRVGIPRSAGPPPPLRPAHPSLSPTGDRIAFSSGGDLWISSINSAFVLQLTVGNDTVDDFPDWASENEIVFQRQQINSEEWEIWTVQVQN